MKNGMLTRSEVAAIRLNYPPGTRLELQHMDDPQPVPDGTSGTVVCVDDGGTIHMEWDNGRSLGLVPQEDQFRKLTPQGLQEEAAMGQDMSLKMH